MKKHFLVCLFTALTLGSFVTSCSDDDDPIVCPIEETTFNTTNGLELTYSGESLFGKQVIFTPNAADASKATLVLSGVNFSVDGMPLTLPGTGVIPGEVTTTINIDNLVIKGDAVSFEGVTELNGNNITYKGSATKSSLKLDLNVTLVPNKLTGKTVKLLQHNVKEKTTPITMDWVADATFPFLGTQYDLHNMLALVQMIDIIEVKEGAKKVALGAALNMVLDQVSFLADGNIQAKYKDAPTDTEWKNSPLNIASYVMGADGRLRLFINADQILAFEQSASRAGFADVIPALIEAASKLMVEGIPVTVKEVDGVTQFYLDEKTLLPIVSMLKPLLNDPEFVKQIVKLIADLAGPEMGPLVQVVVGPLLQALPNIIDKTTMMHFGINTVAL